MAQESWSWAAVAVGSGVEKKLSRRPYHQSPRARPPDLLSHVDTRSQRGEAVDAGECLVDGHPEILPVAAEASWIHLRRPCQLLVMSG